MNYGDCIGCGLCVLGCPASEETGMEALSAKGRNFSLQAGLNAGEMTEQIWACTMCGYCDGVCPKGVRNVELVLALRRELNHRGSERKEKNHGGAEGKETNHRGAEGKETNHRGAEGKKTDHGGSERKEKDHGGAEGGEKKEETRKELVLGCTIRERAAHLIPSIQSFLKKIGLPAEIAEEGCCGSLDVEAGRAMPSKSKAGVVCDPVCMEQYDGEFLGELAMRRLEQFDFGRSVYYFVPHRLVNRQHGRFYPPYHAMRQKLRCETNLDLNRLARSTTMGSLQGLTGQDTRDVKLLVGRLLEQVKAERIVTCSPADYLAFRQFSKDASR